MSAIDEMFDKKIAIIEASRKIYCYDNHTKFGNICTRWFPSIGLKSGSEYEDLCFIYDADVEDCQVV